MQRQDPIERQTAATVNELYPIFLAIHKNPTAEQDVCTIAAVARHGCVYRCVIIQCSNGETTGDGLAHRHHQVAERSLRGEWTPSSQLAHSMLFPTPLPNILPGLVYYSHFFASFLPRGVTKGFFFSTMETEDHSRGSIMETQQETIIEEPAAFASNFFIIIFIPILQQGCIFTSSLVQEALLQQILLDIPHTCC